MEFRHDLRNTTYTSNNTFPHIKLDKNVEGITFKLICSGITSLSELKFAGSPKPSRLRNTLQSS